MNDISWVAVVGVLLLISQLVNLYNSSKTARKNAYEPIEELKKGGREMHERITKIEYRLDRTEEDVDRAHAKIRENQESANEVAKAQNKALLAILLWIKDPDHGDRGQIDEAIKGISVQ